MIAKFYKLYLAVGWRNCHPAANIVFRDLRRRRYQSTTATTRQKHDISPVPFNRTDWSLCEPWLPTVRFVSRCQSLRRSKHCFPVGSSESYGGDRNDVTMSIYLAEFRQILTEDRHWVINELMRNQEGISTNPEGEPFTHINLCINYRDFLPGDPTQMNIIKAIERTRKTNLW